MNEDREAQQDTTQSATVETQQQEAPPADSGLQDQIATLQGQLAQLVAQKEEQETAQKAAETRAAEEKARSEGTLEDFYKEKLDAAEKERKQLRKERRRHALEIAAKDAGIRDVEYLKMADLSAVKVSDEGAVIGATEAIASMKERFPALFGQQQQQRLSGGAPASSPQGQVELTEDQKRFKKQFGWESFGDQYKDPQSGKTITFTDMYTGAFKKMGGVRNG